MDPHGAGNDLSPYLPSTLPTRYLAAAEPGQRKNWTPWATAILVAAVINAGLLAAIVALNRHDRRRVSSELTFSWVTFRKPERPREITTLRAPLKQVKRPRRKPPPRKIRTILRPAALKPRALKPRPRVMPRLKVQPEIVPTPLRIDVQIPDIAVPDVKLSIMEVSGLTPSYDTPEIISPPVSNSEPPEQPRAEPPPGPATPPAPRPEPKREPAPPPKRASVEQRLVLDRKPIPVHMRRPRYPLAAKTKGIEGYAVIKLWIDASGRVKKVVVLESRGHPSFGAAAKAAARGWRFRPAFRYGRPVAITCTQTIRFQLSN